MGVTIHYRGKLDNTDQLPEFLEKLMSIATGFGWKFLVLDEDWSVPVNAVLKTEGKNPEIKGHLGLKGIQLQPSGGSESLDFFFDSNGYLLSPMNVILILEGHLTVEDAWISVKSQFSSAEMHVMIIGLLKYIKEHHLPNLEVQDEGGYWETGDHRALIEKMRLIQDKIDYLSRELSSEPLDDLSVDEIAARIEWLFHSEGMDSKDIN